LFIGSLVLSGWFIGQNVDWFIGLVWLVHWWGTFIGGERSLVHLFIGSLVLSGWFIGGERSLVHLFIGLLVLSGRFNSLVVQWFMSVVWLSLICLAALSAAKSIG
jgi:hypothetical protein